jgi:TIR domain
LKIGDEICPRIDESIRVHDKLLIVLSKNPIGSWWVKKEVETAFQREARHKRPVLFPIRLDNEVMQTDQAWAADVRRTRHIGDFTGGRITGDTQGVRSAHAGFESRDAQALQRCTFGPV